MVILGGGAVSCERGTPGIVAELHVAPEISRVFSLHAAFAKDIGVAQRVFNRKMVPLQRSESDGKQVSLNKAPPPPTEFPVQPSSGSNVVLRRTRPGIAGLGPDTKAAGLAI